MRWTMTVCVALALAGVTMIPAVTADHPTGDKLCNSTGWTCFEPVAETDGSEACAGLQAKYGWHGVCYDTEEPNCVERHKRYSIYTYCVLP